MGGPASPQGDARRATNGHGGALFVVLCILIDKALLQPRHEFERVNVKALVLREHENNIGPRVGPRVGCLAEGLLGILPVKC